MYSFIEVNKKRIISQSQKPLIIAEIGINHFGSLKIAKKLVIKAKKSGAEAVKVQIHIADEEMSEESKKIRPGNSNLSIYDVIKNNSLSLKDEILLRKFIKEKNLIYIATPFSYKAVDFLKKNPADIVKIGSGECNNQPLINYICSLNKPVILSTGMNTVESIKSSIKVLEKNKIKYILLYCVNLYPAPLHLIRLNAIKQYKKYFNKAIAIGYSDHTEGIETAAIALSLGAKIIEKHFVLSKKDKGPDVKCSMDPEELKKLLSISNNLNNLVNKPKKNNKEEQVTKNFAFHSVVAKKNIYSGELLSFDNLTTKRPATGDFRANDIYRLINKKVKKKIKKNFQIKKRYLK
jgi:N-acetylneuraminate synthase